MDGLPDYIEEEIGTDVNNPDSDADGLTDSLDIILGYNPLSNDTDTNGIPDGEEDYDNDGLTNLQEIELGTEIGSYDTDGDELSDGDEVNIYGTDPLKYDTDGDGISDGEEVHIGKAPNDSSDGGVKVLQTVTTNISNADDPAITAVDISLATEGSLEYAAYAEDLYNIDVYSTDVVGRIGSPFELYSSLDFDTATVTIHYDDTQLGDTSEEDLGVLWYDEESGFYITQDQAVVDTANNTVTVALEHFSTYVLVDLQKWNNVEPIEYVAPVVEQNYDFYFALDVSQNMTIEARLRALSTLQDFVSNMRSGDRVCIIYFDTSYYVYNLPINVGNQDEVAAMMSLAEQNLRTASLGGSYGSYILPFQVTESLINNYVQDIGNKKALYILSNDTETVHALNYSDEMMSRMQSGGFTANFVMMDNQGEGQWNFGWKYAAETGSNYYGYEQTVNLWDQFYSLYGQKDGWDIDNDGDGLPDMVENQGMMGTNKKVYFSSSDKIHSDEDGLTDGEEMGQRYTFINQFENGVSNPVMIPSNPVNAKNISSYYPKNVNAKAYYYEAKSDPTLDNTDRDRMKDNEDSYPTDYQQNMIYILYLEDNDKNLSDARLFWYTYRKFNLNCQIYGFNGIDSFINMWNNIGIKNSSDMSTDDFFNVTDVVIVSEGSKDGIELSFHPEIVPHDPYKEDWLLARASSCISIVNNIGVSDLADKNIDNLHLRTCFAGVNLTGGVSYSNLAVDFLTAKNNIKNIYAFDCALGAQRFEEGAYSLLGVTNTTSILALNTDLILIPTVTEIPIEEARDPNVHQQLKYCISNQILVSTLHTEQVAGGILQIVDCYLEDYLLGYVSKLPEYEYKYGEVEYISHFDPILDRYGYDF